MAETTSVAPRDGLGTRRPARWKRGAGPGVLLSFSVIIFAILMPAACLGFELVFRMCREELLDPIPTTAHVLAIAFVPIAGLSGWRGLHASTDPRSRWWGLGVGAALPITLVYFVGFLPMVPIGLFALIIGFGIFVLAPVACFPTFLVLSSALLRRARAHGLARVPGLREGIVIGLTLFLAIDLPGALTGFWMQRASSADPAESVAAVRKLRRFGSRQALQDAASGTRPETFGPLSMLLRFSGSGGPALADDGRTNVDVSRKIWFRVTGERFDGPLTAPADAFFFEGWGEVDWDLGGGRVGLAQRTLRLASSRIDGAIDPTAGVGYLEWIFEFENQARFQDAEARALIELPDESVVSRLTLWIDGEEREAAYAGRGDVRRAYEAVAIRAGRDPALVTTCGDDRVLLQCFPVPAGSRLRVKIGVTTPLELTRDSSRLRLPLLLERNFVIPDSVYHDVWIESDQELRPSMPALSAARDGSGGSDVRGSLAESDLAFAATGGALVAPRDPVEEVAWARPDASGEEITCVFRTRSAAEEAPVVVIDGSASLRPFWSELADALAAELEGEVLEDLVLLAAEQGTLEIPASSIRERLGEAGFHGGVDDVPALARAWDLASSRPGRDILWICGPQPVVLSSVEGLRQRFERTTGGPRILCLQLVPGENVILAELEDQGRMESFPRTSGIRASIARALGRGDASLERVYLSRKETASARRAPEHLATLWASREVERLLAERPPRREEAKLLAARHHIVTPVSGAVVLERAEHYEAHKLEPASADDLPSVPEPAEILLAVVVLGAAGLALGMRAAIRGGTGG